MLGSTDAAFGSRSWTRSQTVNLSVSQEVHPRNLPPITIYSDSWLPAHSSFRGWTSTSWKYCKENCSLELLVMIFIVSFVKGGERGRHCRDGKKRAVSVGMSNENVKETVVLYLIHSVILQVKMVWTFFFIYNILFCRLRVRITFRSEVEVREDVPTQKSEARGWSTWDGTGTARAVGLTCCSDRCEYVFFLPL